MKTVYVAMSGGVDSSVAAALLAKKFNVVGVYFKPWSPGNGTVYCNWQQDRLDAMRVATKLGIEFKTWDFSKEYGREVTQYMIEGYRKGITPNPDVMCNKEIKFGIFLKKALEAGADYIATGHYAKTKNGKLYKAKDKNKDQTYFLWTLTKEQLSHTLFPLGGYTKPEVRKLAKKFKLPNFAKKDSQGVCFVGELDMHDFLAEYIKPKQGDIICDGNVIGIHDGVSYYTIGQRHGMDIKNGGGPYFVIDKNIDKNVLYVTKDEQEVMKNELRVGEIHWINKPKQNAAVQIRYRSLAIPAEILMHNSQFIIRGRKPFKAAAPGQSAVFYTGQEVLGGGIVQ